MLINKLINRKKNLTETFVHLIFFILGIIAIIFVLLMTFYVIISGIPAIKKIGLTNFLFGRIWSPTSKSPKYGILPFILTTIYGTIGAIAFAIPVGFFCSVYISKISKGKIRFIIERLISLLSSIPSVVIGFVGMMFLVNMIKKIFNLTDGSSLFASVIVLFIMILPSVIKISVSVLDAVPKDYEMASLALGATDIETYFRVSVKTAKSGIVSAIIIGIGRAIGESMAIMMVSGNVANMPSLFQSVRFLTTAIATEMSYSSGLHREALFSIALILFALIMFINGVLKIFTRERGTK